MVKEYYPIVLLLSILVLTSCGGGSGEPSVATTSSDLSSSSVTCVVSECSTAAGFETAEYNQQKGLAIINASNAYSHLFNLDKDYLGDGVVVAVVDTGTLGTHVDLEANYNSIFSVGDTGTTSEGYSNGFDLSGHGTHVAGIIGASLDNSQMHGVAPNATIVGVAYSNITGVEDGTFDFEDVVINSKATVVNMSFGNNVLGSTYAELTDILSQSSVSSDVVLVAAAGNDRLATDGNLFWNDAADEPIYPAHYADEDNANFEFLEGQMLAVVSVNTSGKRLGLGFADVQDNGVDYLTSIDELICTGPACISWYSNFCGGAEKFCLAAPGGDNYSYSGDSANYNINSTYIDSTDSSNVSTYANLAGTSMASPQVAGAAAILQGAWPSLTGDDVVDILISTATYVDCSEVNLSGDSVCTESTDSVGNYNNVYGRGLLNLFAAVQNSGSSSLFIEDSFSSNSFNLHNSSLSLPSLFGTSLVDSSLLKQAVFFDEYNRDYPIDLRSRVSSPNILNRFKIGSYLEQVSYVKPVDFSLNNNVNFSFIYNERETEYAKYEKEKRYITKTGEVGSFHQISVGNVSFTESFLKSSLSFSYYSNLDSNYASKHQNFLALTDNEDAFYSLASKEATQLSFSYNLGHNFDFVNIYKQSLKQEDGNDQGAIITTGLNYGGGSFDLEFLYSIAKYQSGVWGANGSEAFSFGEANQGDIYELSLQKRFSDGLSFNANYQHSFINDGDNVGIISNLEGLAANSVSFSLNKISRSSRYGFGYSIPPAITSGSFDLTIATGRNDNNIIIAHEEIDLAVEDREQILELYYHRSGSILDLRTNFFLRENFKNITGAKDEMVLFNFTKAL